MNIGIYVSSLRPRAAAQTRFQESLFAGLERLSAHRYHFMVFTHEGAEGFVDSEDFTYHRLRRDGRWAPLVRWLKPRLGGLFLATRRMFGAGGGRLNDLVTRWMSVEPAYCQQLRDLDVRLLWNMSQHQLASPLPFIRTIWDVNHRIHSMYPEFSYTNRGYDSNEASVQTLHQVPYVLVGTHEGRRQLVDFYGVHDGKVRVIPFPTPVLPDAGERPGSAATTVRKPYLFYPARFWPHKNHAVLGASQA